jgi:hypothetical protein
VSCYHCLALFGACKLTFSKITCSSVYHVSALVKIFSSASLLGPSSIALMASTTPELCKVCNKPDPSNKNKHRCCTWEIKVEYFDKTSMTLKRDPSTLEFRCYCDKNEEPHGYKSKDTFMDHVNKKKASYKVCKLFF